MSERAPEGEEVVLPGEVMDLVRPVAARLGRLLAARGDFDGQFVAGFLASDEGVVALLSAAYKEGAEAVAAGLERLEPARADAYPPDPSYGERDRGEKMASWRAENACLRCSHMPVCAVARAAATADLVAVSRCLRFFPK